MQRDINSLQEEFEAFSKCGVNQSSEEEIDEVEDEGGFIATVQSYLLPPAKCGVYLSRLDIKVIGLKFDEDVQIRERKRMLRDILKAVTTKEDMEKIFSFIKDSVDEKVDAYDELVQNFPETIELFEDKKQKAQKFKKVLDKIVEDFESELKS